MTFIPNSIDKKTSFDELYSAELTPIIQEEAINGISDKMAGFNFGTGSGTTATDSEFVANSGTDAGGFGVILTDQTLICSSMQGAISRISAIFGAAVTGYQQLAGTLIGGDTLAFSYLDLNFGIQYTRNGKNEIQELKIDSATTTGGNLTITVNSVAYTVPVTIDTVEANAVEITDSLNAQVPLYLFTANEDTIVMRSSLPVSQGTFSFALDTAVGTAGTFTQISSGDPGTATFINQTDWTVDKMDGSGPSGMTLVPTKGNVYGIQMSCSGYGALQLYIANSVTGKFQLVHQIINANTATAPFFGDSFMRVGWSAASTGGSGTDVTIKGANLGVFIEGKRIEPGNALSAEATVVSVTPTFVNILTVRNRMVRGDRRNRRPTQILRVSGLTDSTKGVVVRVLRNATVTETNFKYIDKDSSNTEVDVAGTTVVGGELRATLTIGATGSATIDLEEFGIGMAAEDTITLSAAVVSAPNSSVTVSIDFRENV